MKIHQLQATYLVEHDRILVRLNTHAGEELRLWLTRRMVKNLFPHMLQASTEIAAPLALSASHDGSDRRALAEFKKQETLQKSDFNTPFSTQAAILPIGGDPLLATTVHVTPTGRGSLRVGFEEKVPGAAQSRGFEVTLGPDLLPGFMHLLELALKHADWGIALREVETVQEANPMDTFATAQAPKYLN
ncbi:hypothetical protein [Rhodoferax sp.]|uniref:hypothetical protein n=1 Tax=Rhodoferax sp. TaxID=50421 RepID=UPI0027435087|nr:hypothetical protein [Rhodoferax sp.]